ncbi:hypothetical protein [Bacillus thuringiensis]|uniref:hypothetical protein n=1 Tax=Bacillus thuringiensis TaxID=1428 RepID=UPI00159C7725|nr:hypothetical protein [Bacillus thuringiensis]
MSKVNVDEIKVGDLIGFDNYNKKIALGYVTEIKTPVVGCTQFWCHFSCKKDPERIGFLYDYNIDYHWKVINFEEEAKTDELKVYTGKETIEALLGGKVLQSRPHKYQYKMNDTEILKLDRSGEWIGTLLSIKSIMDLEFTEVATPQVGDWVKTCGYVGQITKVDGTYMYAHWSNIPHMETPIFLKHDWEILSPEEVSEYKREQAFSKVGRKLNEFRSGDIVFIEYNTKLSIVVSNNNKEDVKLHGVNETGKGYRARPHQLTPISFVEQQVDLS